MFNHARFTYLNGVRWEVIAVVCSCGHVRYGVTPSRGHMQLWRMS